MKKYEIGQFVAERRKSLRVTQAELARICGISAHALCNFERGVGNTTFDLLEKVLDTLGLEIKLQAKNVDKL